MCSLDLRIAQKPYPLHLATWHGTQSNNSLKNFKILLNYPFIFIGRAKIAQFLIANMADVTATNDKGLTSLFNTTFEGIHI